MTLLNKPWLTSVCVVVLGLCVATDAIAMPVHATNDVIGTKGRIYIPLQPETSGGVGTLILQAPTNPRRRPKKHIVGLKRDKVRLDVANPVSTGYVTMFSAFDLSGEFSEEFPVVDRSADMTMTLTGKDLDFLPDNKRKLNFRESLLITLVDSNDMPIEGAGSLLIDDGTAGEHYMQFRQDVDRKGRPVTRTNRKKATYEVSLMSLFGSNINGRMDFITMLNEEQKFKVKLTLASHMQFTGTRGRKRVRNTRESIGGPLLMFGVAPEPGALSVLAIGGIVLAVRRRRRA